MLTKSRFARSLAMAAAIPIVSPPLPAAETAKTSQQRVARGMDVVLVSGSLNGKLLTANGKPVSGTPVVISRDNKVIARTVTSADGSYEVKGLTSGTHTVSMTDGHIPVRLWTQETAPTCAREQMVVSQTAVRGQFTTQDGLLIGTTLLATSALIVAIIAYEEAEEAEEQAASP